MLGTTCQLAPVKVVGGAVGQVGKYLQSTEGHCSALPTRGGWSKHCFIGPGSLASLRSLCFSPRRPTGTRLKGPFAVTHPAQVSRRAGEEPQPQTLDCQARGRPGAGPGRQRWRVGRPTMLCEGSPSSGFRSTTLAAPVQARPRPAAAGLLRDWSAVLLGLPSLLPLALFRLSLEGTPPPVADRDSIGHLRELPAASRAGWLSGLSVGAVTRQRVGVRLFPRQ